MHTARIADLLRLGPGGHALFVADVGASDDVARLIAGLANADGGTLVFGAETSGRVRGVGDVRGGLGRIAAGAQRVTPQLLLEPHLIKHAGRELIALDVQRGADPPYAVDGQLWVRGRKGVHGADPEQAADLARRALRSATLVPAASAGRAAKGPVSVDLEHILLKLERLIVANAELTRKLEAANSWRSRMIDQVVGALIGLALSALMFYLLGIG